MLTLIAQDYHADDDEERGFWILGPQEEEIRSDWRGKPLHSLVLAALLHPRATKLPAHVQVVYIHAAMKVFAAACADCDETQLAKSVGILRQKLPAFTQSEHLEVQERACLLRHLLSELGVLSLSWKTTLEAQRQRSNGSETGARDSKNGGTNVSNGKQSGAISNILDVMAALDEELATTDAVDSRGARVAKQKFRVFGAVLNEPFHPVHPKAQRKVPPPAELDLDEPFLASALDQLLATALPEKASLSDLAFTSPYVSSNFAPSAALAGIGGGYTRYADEEGDTGRGTWSDGSPAVKSDASSASTSTSRLVPATASGGNSMYYLQTNGVGSREPQPANPLSKLLAETFVDTKAKKSKVRRVKQQVNSAELLPAGATDADSDEDAPVAQRVPHRARQRRSEGSGGLDAVDLTTPLRDDETYVVLKHREVSLGAPSGRSGADHASPAEGGDKKKKKKSKSKSASTSATVTAASVNLLDAIDETAAPITKSGRKTKAHATDDLLGLVMNPSSPSPPAAVLPVANVPVDLMGAGGRSSARNKITDSFSDLALSGSDGPVATASPTPVGYAAAPQTSNASFSLEMLKPLALNQDQFAELLSASGRHWSRTSLRVPYRSKTRSATKTLAATLRAHVIESESSRASSLCARSAAGDHVCCLLKFKKEEGLVAIDVKCAAAGGDKTAAQVILQTVVDAVTGLSL